MNWFVIVVKNASGCIQFSSLFVQLERRHHGQGELFIICHSLFSFHKANPMCICTFAGLMSEYRFLICEFENG